VTSANYDANNRLTQWTMPGGGVTPAYDNNGNLACDGTKAIGSTTTGSLLCP
jgi:hypothetical protein